MGHSASIPVEERRDLGRLVTFVPNKKTPVHNWFYFKEGFSRDFVLLIFEWLKVTSGDRVLDPFCGVGTTLLASKEAGVNAVGVDVAPLQVFVAQVKTADYDAEELKDAARELFAKRFKKYDIRGLSPLAKRAFSRYALEDILFFREELRQTGEPRIKNFFTLALMNAANKVTYAYKDGAVIKIREKPAPPLKKMFRRVVKRMIRDVKRAKHRGAEVKVYLEDARRLDFLPEKHFDAVITSPPYLNRIEYSKVYALEYELFLGDVRVDGMRSYMGLNPRNLGDPFPEVKLPAVAKAYMQDMSDALEGVYRVAKDGAECAMVVTDGVFPDGLVPTDLLISRLADRVGFTVERIVVVNRRVVTRDRTVKVGRARESLVVMKK